MKHTKNLLVLSLALLGASAFAQVAPPAGGPKDGPVQRPDDGPGRRPHPRPDGGTGLLLRPEVRAELRLTDDQVARIQALAPTPHSGPPLGSGTPAGDPAGPRPGNDPKPGGPRMEEPKGGVPKDGPEERLRSILTPKQATRIRQIRLQREGARAILRPDVAKDLGLSEEQIGRMRPAPPKEGEAPRPPQAGDRPDPRQEDDRVLQMLTEDQRAKWREMQGKPFAFGEDRTEQGDAPPGPPRNGGKPASAR